ncbi:helix-turn-helix domain-containing protein [Methylomonas sp. 11b]|uniref:helix-turn-helix domain-containing protein n=1 Tax=Methylomonas sp. 11b TaxID=1168169 RepID=UPI00047A9837|nr:helix-turn-helix domain-containing protein [Methylomonas sp. 11b]
MAGYKRIQFDDRMDKIIRTAYLNGHKKTGDVGKAALRLGISQSSITRRAAEIGCLRAGYKTWKQWTPAEIELLENNAHKSLNAINQILVRAGHPSRSLDAVKSKLNDIQINRRQARADAGLYTIKELQRLMGCSEGTIQRAIKSGHLKASQRKDVNQPEYNITAADVRAYIKNCLPSVDIATCDKYWLIDLLTGVI